jgi:hypothetical protein
MQHGEASNTSIHNLNAITLVPLLSQAVPEACPVGIIFEEKIGGFIQRLTRTPIDPANFTNGTNLNSGGGIPLVAQPCENSRPYESFQSNSGNSSSSSSSSSSYWSPLAIWSISHGDSTIQKNMDPLSPPNLEAETSKSISNAQPKSNNNVTLRSVFYFFVSVILVAVVLLFLCDSTKFDRNTWGMQMNSTVKVVSNQTVQEKICSSDHISNGSLAEIEVGVSGVDSAIPSTQNSTIDAVRTVVVLIGRTGDGKSASGNLMISILKHENKHKENSLRVEQYRVEEPINPFSESAGADSHTALPQSFTVDGFRVIDTPGLMDNKGLAKDEENIVEIVKFLIREGAVNGFVLVVNEQAPRFDGPMQDAVKLLVDTFGPEMLNHMGILFTRSTHKIVEESVQYVNEHFVPALKAKIGYNISFLPSWQVENHPEKLRQGMLNVSRETVDMFHARNIESVRQLKNWASAKPALDISNTKPGKYASTTKMQKMLLEVQFNNTIDPSKTRGECREVQISRTREESRRYGSKCIWGIFGGRQFKDHWDDVTYRRECRSIFTKNNGELHSDSPWESSGDPIKKQENKETTSYC